LKIAATEYKSRLTQINVNATVEHCYDFIMERARAYYIETGIMPDVFDSVLTQRPSQPFDFDQRIKAVTEFRKLPEAESLSAANKRIANILKNLSQIATKIDESLLKEPAEKDLYNTLNNLVATVQPMFARRDYQLALTELAKLRTTVDRFFDDVMVMVDDDELKNNRLALLQNLRGQFLQVADLSRLQS